jgi:signal transduction histidine kinase
MRTTTDETAAEPLRVLHLAEDPNDSFLLGEELREQNFAPTLRRVTSTAELRAQVTSFDPAVLVVDLPLLDGVSPTTLDELQAQRPQVGLVFRWGSSGSRVTEAPSEQLGRRIRATLLMRPQRPQDAATRAGTVLTLVRRQQAYLELARGDLWDFEATLHAVTETMARELDVQRVSVWELSGDQQALRCLDLFERATGRHSAGTELKSFPTYLESLRNSLTLGTSDAPNDPRTRELASSYLLPLGITAMLDAPIRRGGRVVGVLCHESTAQPAREWGLLDQCAATQIAGLVAKAFEVRERRRLEERLQQLQRLDVISEVAQGLAHDMNNLLTVLGGSLEEMALSAGDPESRSESLDAARLATEGLRAMASSLGRIGRGERLQARPLELGDWLRRQVLLCQAALQPRSRLHCELPDQQLRVNGDADALGRVLLNLVRNADESMPTGGVITIRLSRERVTELTDLVASDCARIEVEDTGVGIRPEVRRDLFRPFFSTKGGTTAGRGHGLATALGLVRQHGGTILVDSELGKGSRFQVLLPLGYV